jgi:hypothetical protein
MSMLLLHLGKPIFNVSLLYKIYVHRLKVYARLDSAQPDYML